MARDKYISVKQGISGFSFANLGLFTGFADGIYNAVYSLVLMEIFANSAVVGIYVAIYATFCMFVGLFANELFRRFSKARVLFFNADVGNMLCNDGIFCSPKHVCCIGLYNGNRNNIGRNTDSAVYV